MIGYAIRRENVKLLRKMKYYEHTECLNNYDAIYERYIAARYIDNGTTQMLSNLLRTNRTSTLYFYFSYVKRRIYNSIGFASGREDYHLFMPLLAWLIFCYFCDSTNPRFYCFREQWHILSYYIGLIASLKMTHQASHVNFKKPLL